MSTRQWLFAHSIYCSMWPEAHVYTSKSSRSESSDKMNTHTLLFTNDYSSLGLTSEAPVTKNCLSLSCCWEQQAHRELLKEGTKTTTFCGSPVQLIHRECLESWITQNPCSKSTPCFWCSMYTEGFMEERSSKNDLTKTRLYIQGHIFLTF